jgi:hypothetical protein
MCSQSLMKENQQMTGMFKSLKSTILIFEQTHKLTTCWTDEYKVLAHLEFEYEISSAICKHNVEIGKSKCESEKQTPCITKCVPLQISSLLRHTKIHSLQRWPTVPFIYCYVLQVLLLILCSLLGNTRDVTAKQMDGAVPIFWSAVSSRYQHAACYFEHRFAGLP